MSRNSKIIAVVLAVLIALTGIAIALNYHQARDQLSLLESQEILISENGAELQRITLAELLEIGPSEFKANLKSSAMFAPEEHTYTGIALSDLFSFAGVSLEEKSRIFIKSVDGYTVPLKIEEVLALDNVFLVYRDDGEYLGSINEGGGQGPYMIVVREDKFSQRWAKYVIGLDIE